MAGNFNDLQNLVFTAEAGPQHALSSQDRILIEALLQDSGVLPMAVGGGGQSPPTSPSPPSPGPPPPSPAPAPAPPSSNPILRLAMSTVKAGDLITAGFMNTLIDALFALDERLKRLEDLAPTPTPAPAPAPSPPPPSPAGGAIAAESAAAPASASDLAAPAAAAGRSAGQLEPVIENAIATPTKGEGLRITVTGNNIDEGIVEEARLGKTKFARSKLKFDEAGFSFLTTNAVLQAANNVLTVITVTGRDEADVSTAGKEPAK